MLHARTDYNDRVRCVDGSIPENEPVFLVRAQDALSAVMIEYYLRRYKQW